MIERGSVVLVALKGSYGKPRPAPVVQNDHTIPVFDSVAVGLPTSEPARPNPLRIAVGPGETDELQHPSFVQVDKVQTVLKSRVRGPVGRIAGSILHEVELALAFHLNLYALAKPTEYPS